MLLGIEFRELQQEQFGPLVFQDVSRCDHPLAIGEALAEKLRIRLSNLVGQPRRAVLKDRLEGVGRRPGVFPEVREVVINVRSDGDASDSANLRV